MPRFDVDVKAFLKLYIEAETVEAAAEEAKAFVEGLAPEAAYLAGWNSTGEHGATIVELGGGFDCDDTPYIEDENGDEVDPGA